MTAFKLIDIRYFTLEGEISHFRRLKADAYLRERDRLLSLAAAHALRLLLAPLGYEEMNMRYTADATGKPRFENCPLHFSLSHSGFYAAAAISDSEVGIDVQEVFKCDMRIAQRCFSAAEMVSIQSARDPDLAFTRIWALRESAAKLHGGGLKSMQDSRLHSCNIYCCALEGAYLALTYTGQIY